MKILNVTCNTAHKMLHVVCVFLIVVGIYHPDIFRLFCLIFLVEVCGCVYVGMCDVYKKGR